MIWYVVSALIIVCGVALDQITKAVVVSNIELYGSVKVIPGFIRFYRTENTGGAFSMLNQHPVILMIFTLIAMGIVAFLLIKFIRRHPLLTVTLSMILAGGIGNLIDRVFSGKVVDFIEFDFLFFGFFRFAVFNVADIFVTVGAVCLAVYIIAFEPKVEKRIREKKAEAEAVPEAVDSSDVPSGAEEEPSGDKNDGE